jgi:hypothetical protein
MNQPNKEASKRIILNSVSEMDTLVTHPKDDVNAYHHANALLTQVILALLAYTNDEEVYKAVDDLLAVHQVIADRIGVRPHIYAIEGEEEENEVEHFGNPYSNPEERDQEQHYKDPEENQ